ncbi:MAG: hypothetical protein WC861_00895 [Candidatus Micrarchaeia archaeon]
MRQKTMQKLIVPVALAAALTFHSPFIRAGEGARLIEGKAPMGLASQEAAHPRACSRLIGKTAGVCKRQPARMGGRALEVKAEPALHEDGGKAGAPWWLSALASLSALVNLGLFYGGTVWKVWKTKGTESFSKASRVLISAGALLWVGYGVCVNDWAVIAMTGLALPGSIYLTCLKLKNNDKPRPMAPKEKRISEVTTGAAVLAFTSLAAIEFLFGNSSLGILATALGGVAVILRNLSPWAQAIKTMLDKSTKNFNFWATILDPPSSAIWVAYGWAQHEMPVMISNLLSLAAGAIVAGIMLKNRKKDRAA